MSNLDERYFQKTEKRYYSLIENGEVVVGVVDKDIAEKWLERKLEIGSSDVAIMPIPKEYVSEEVIEDVETDNENEVEEVVEEIIEDLEEGSNNGSN